MWNIQKQQQQQNRIFPAPNKQHCIIFSRLLLLFLRNLFREKLLFDVIVFKMRA